MSDGKRSSIKSNSSFRMGIAEGAGEYSNDEKIRFCRMAKRSATECAGIFDLCCHLNLVAEAQYSKARTLLVRIVSMLIKMSQKSHRSELSGTGTHTGTGTKWPAPSTTKIP